jgi:hypothetical protein
MLNYVKWLMNSYLRMRTPLSNKEFQKLRNLLDSCPSINEGGCGVAAYVMYRWLQENGWKTAQIVYAYCGDNWDRREYNENYVTLGGGIARSCSHAFIEISELDLSFDCGDSTDELEPEELGGVEKLEEFTRVPHELVDSFMVASMLDQDEWNSGFARSNIPLMHFMAEVIGIQTPALLEITRNDSRLFLQGL